jgi:NTE family protein
MALGTLASPRRHTPLQLVAGWAPSGIVSTDSIKDTVRRAVPGHWAAHPNFWAIATDYGTGKRVAFGRTGSPRAELADAVAASCAIPGFYRPVKIGGRRYVDGGVCSASNLDVLAGRGLDLIICLNPMSSRTGSTGFFALDRFNAFSRTNNGRRLGHEARKVEAYGTRVALIQPTPEDHAVMGRNLMSGTRRNAVIETAQRTVAEQIHALGGLLDGLPEGEPHKLRRPSGPPSAWPELLPTQQARRAA